MQSVVKDLQPNIKKKFIQELVSSKYILVDDKPIGSCAFGYVFKIKKHSLEGVECKQGNND